MSCDGVEHVAGVQLDDQRACFFFPFMLSYLFFADRPCIIFFSLPLPLPQARRRILAPAHRATQAGTANGPYATVLSGGGGAPHTRSLIDAGRRASMPTDSLALYHPMSLQSIPDYATGGGPSTRQLVSISRSMSSGHASVGSLSGHHHLSHHHHHPQHHLSHHPSHQPHQHHHPYAGIDSYGGSHTRPSLYGSGGGSALHPSSHASSGTSTSTSGGAAGGGGGGYLGAPPPPMSAPASMSTPNPFTSSSSSSSYPGGGSYGRVSPDSLSGGGGGIGGGGGGAVHTTSQARYSFPGAPNEHSVSPGPGSGYNTPH